MLAILLTFQKDTIVTIIAANKRIMSTRANEMLCKLKNIIDHIAFSVSWIKNTKIGILAFSDLTQMSHKEIPINVYKVVQTGPNK
jgi:hypothetical protein